MPDPNPTPEKPDHKAFPFLTVAASFLTFFAFLALVLVAYHSPNYLNERETEQKTDPAVKLNEVKAKNEAAIAGAGGKMSVVAATAELLGKLKNEKDRLPFPTPEPAGEPKK